MRMTLLEMVQGVLNEMDSEPVASLSDTLEAYQVARVIQDIYFNYTVNEDLPESQQLVQLDVYSDSEFPTFLKYPTKVKEVRKLLYLIDDVWTEIYYKDPECFFKDMPRAGTEDTSTDPSGTYTVFNTRRPTYYTTVDQDTIIFNSYNKHVDDTIQAHKTRVFATVYPEFKIEDSFIPDVSDQTLAYIYAEAKAYCFDLFKGGTTSKQEQIAKRLRSGIQNDNYRTKQKNRRPRYGRC